MVIVKTDTNIYLNVEEFRANEGRLEKAGFRNAWFEKPDVWFEKPGLYIKPTDYDEYVPVIYCDVEKAKKMLFDIACEISRYRADGLVLEVHDGKIRSL